VPVASRHQVRWFFGRALRVLFHLVSAALRKSSPEVWNQAVREVGAGGGLPIAREVSFDPGASENERLQTLTQQDSPADTAQLAVRNQVLPRVTPDWAREIQPFLANLLSRHSRLAYETDLRQFFQFLATRSDVADLTLLRPEHVIVFRKHLEEGRLTGKPMQKSTINRKLAVVKSFFQWLRANGLTRENPASLVKGFPQTQESSLNGLSDEEAQRMLDATNLSSRSGNLHSAVLHVLLYLGLRKGELIGLRMGDVTEERGTPVIRVRGKGHRVRVLPIVPRVRTSLDRYFAACGRDPAAKEAPLFTPTRNPHGGVLNKPLNPNAVTYLVVRYARRAGVLKPVSPHSCRATCISNALDRKATHRSVQHLAGWSTPLMIQRYDKRREDLRNSAAFIVDYGSGQSVSA